MAARRMNEICPTMALTLVFSVLLFHTCQGQNDPTAAAATSSQTTAMDERKSTQKSLESLTDPSTTNLTNSPVTHANQVADHPDTTSPKALSDSTDEQAHTSLATSETTTPQSNVFTIVAESPNSLDNEPVHKDHRQHNKQDTHMEPEPDMGSPTQTPVFVPLLVSGLILAAVLMGLYVWKNHCHAKTSGMKLAEESYMADKENQGNTLVSVAPLNPPEDQEKPSLNGESLEAVKTQNSPTATNGHSNTKADTEL